MLQLELRFNLYIVFTCHMSSMYIYNLKMKLEVGMAVDIGNMYFLPVDIHRKYFLLILFSYSFMVVYTSFLLCTHEVGICVCTIMCTYMEEEIKSMQRISKTQFFLYSWIIHK